MTPPKFDKKDLAHCDNLIKAMKKAKFELEGMEVVALAEVFRWVSMLYNRISAEASPQEQNKPIIASAKELESPIKEGPVAAPSSSTKTNKKKGE